MIQRDGEKRTTIGAASPTLQYGAMTDAEVLSGNS